jgi:hypothetical protein
MKDRPPSRPHRLFTQRSLIVAGAVGAGVLTATHPAIGVPVAVGAAVLGALHQFTKKDRED